MDIATAAISESSLDEKGKGALILLCSINVDLRTGINSLARPLSEVMLRGILEENGSSATGVTSTAATSLTTVSFGVDAKLDRIQQQLQVIQASRKPAGISTAAEWVTRMRSEGELTAHSQSLQNFLEKSAVSWWPTADLSIFPSEDDTETATCQPFVTARLAEISECSGFVHEKRVPTQPGLSPYLHRTTKVIFHSQAVDNHTIASFRNRRPDITCYDGDRRGGCAITMLGDVKGCGSRNRDFPEEQIGHILDMASELMTKEQFLRTVMFCFLTDGFRFQFFKCFRRSRSDELHFEQSAVYGGEIGWQIFFGLLLYPVAQLGLVTLDVSPWVLVNGLGFGRFSSVFSCNKTSAKELCAMKVFQGENVLMADVEISILTTLNRARVTNIPVCEDLLSLPTFTALVLTPVGLSILPCPMGVFVTPDMVITLIRVVRRVHSLGWIHRDIKPDNIFIDAKDDSRIVLNDWSSGVQVDTQCAYVGTPMFGDAPVASNTHIATPVLDLRCLVKTVFCVSKQYTPQVNDVGDIWSHWNKIKMSFPVFRRAFELADAVDYDQLEDLFRQTW